MSEVHTSRVSDERFVAALAHYLMAKGLAAEKRGYGHATGWEVAEAVEVFLAEWAAGQAAHGKS